MSETRLYENRPYVLLKRFFLWPGVKVPSKLFDFEEDGNFIELIRKWIQEGVEEAEQINHFDQSSFRSSLYSIFRRIEEMRNRGEKAKIDMIKALLDAFEIGEGTNRINTSGTCSKF